MASIAFEEYKNKLNNLRPALDDLGGALHLDEARNEVEKLEEESAQDGFWNDTENSQRVQKRIKTLQHKLERYAKLSGAWEDMLTMCEMAIEEDDDSMLPDLESEFHSFEETLESMRLETLLTGEYDANNAILTFHAAPAAPRRRTGRACSTACTTCGPSATATPSSSWIISTATRPASRARRS